MIRVLHIISSFGRGGAPVLIVNYMWHLPGEDVKFDFLLRSANNAYREEIREHGGRVFQVSEFPRHWLRNALETWKFLKEHSEYQIIHIHCNALIYIFPALAAKALGRRCIIHAHNTTAESPLGRLIHRFHRLGVRRYSDFRFACSDPAGKWCFGRDYTVVKNAVDPKRFFFDAEARRRIRSELSLKDRAVYIHVGRMEQQKNHAFLLKVFRKLKEKDASSVLLLLGSGSLESALRETVRKYGLSDSVLFLGVRDNVNDFLSAADMMIFPSLWEGLGIALIEAQYAGLKTLCSENIVPEVLVTDYLRALELREGSEAWADAALSFLGEKIDPAERERLDTRGYNIRTEAKKLYDFYLKV